MCTQALLCRSDATGAYAKIASVVDFGSGMRFQMSVSVRQLE